MILLAEMTQEGLDLLNARLEEVTYQLLIAQNELTRAPHSDTCSLVLILQPNHDCICWKRGL